MSAIHTLLVANRGEIAVRIFKTARAMGIRTVAVFAESDRTAPHVAAADSAVCLGEGPVNQTYLNQEKLLAAIEQTGANAVHPGYGFLSENAGFAEALIAKDIIWVGPPVSAMTAMASKSRAKQTLEPKGVPMIPGYHGEEQSDDFLKAQADDMGYPVLVKASAGGGGKGMKVVESSDRLIDALHSARREAKNSFGDDHLLLEKYLGRPRHIEVQIMADQHGKVLSLFERDCTVQRRHQKVLEEAPAMGLSDETRHAMYQAAETAAREIGYTGAGTVEFIVDEAQNFYFLEMNTRLQVEHPVTEAITDLDLVEWQLRVAQGEALTAERPESPIGHAIEVRFYAEDPQQNFLPMVGQIHWLSFPELPGVRIDSGIGSSANVSSFYDPMLAKIIVHGKDRTEALTRLQQTLQATECFGLTTNLAFLRQLVAHPAVHSGDIHTRWLDTADELTNRSQLESASAWAALAAVAQQRAQPAPHAWQRHRGWRSVQGARWQFSVSSDQTVTVMHDQNRFTATMGDQSLIATSLNWQTLTDQRGLLTAEVDGQLLRWKADVDDKGVWLDNGDRIERVDWWQLEAELSKANQSAGRQTASLPGVVTAVNCQPGDQIAIGDAILSFEAMKMESTLVAEVAGVVKELPWQVGDQIADGDLLYEIEAEADE